MIYSIPEEHVVRLVIKQLDNMFFISEEEKRIIKLAYPAVIRRVEKNFAASPNKYFNRGEDTYFNPYHSGQWLIFLYFLSFELSHPSGSFDPQYSLADRVYYLNKVMNGCDLFYEVKLPDIFGIEHPVGTVIGKGSIKDGFFFYQGCTVGGTKDSDGKDQYPTIEENVHMFSHSSILGNSHIGKNVNIGAGCIVKNQNVPDNCNVFGESPNLIIKPKKNG